MSPSHRSPGGAHHLRRSSPPPNVGTKKDYPVDGTAIPRDVAAGSEHGRRPPCSTWPRQEAPASTHPPAPWRGPCRDHRAERHLGRRFQGTVQNERRHLLL